MPVCLFAQITEKRTVFCRFICASIIDNLNYGTFCKRDNFKRIWFQGLRYLSQAIQFSNLKRKQKPSAIEAKLIISVMNRSFFSKFRGSLVKIS